MTIKPTSAEKFHTVTWSEDRAWVVLIDASQTWADFKLIEVAGKDQNGVVYFEGDFSVTDPEKAESVVCGFVKWDGCTEAHIDGHHMCDAAKSVLELGQRWAWAVNQCHAAMTAAGVSAPRQVNLLWVPVELAK